MSDFTRLEREVFAAFQEAAPAIAAPLQVLLDQARLIERDNTGHGFFTKFEVDRVLPPLDKPYPFTVDLEVRVRDVVLGMSFILWASEGYPTCLEGWQFGSWDGSSWDGPWLDLRGDDLASLSRANPSATPGTTGWWVGGRISWTE
ncbi:MAG: hypothetical protein AB7O56_16070 [Bauldia sp.]